MKNTNRFLILLAIFLITLSTTSVALAKDGGRSEGSKGDDKDSKVEIKVKNEAEEENEVEEENEQVEQVEVGAAQFEIRREITAVVGNNFTVAGQTIFGTPLPFSIAPSLPTSSASSTSSANIRVKVKAEGAADQIRTFLQQILTFLQSLTT